MPTRPAGDISNLQTWPNLTNLSPDNASQVSLSQIDSNSSVPQGAKDVLHRLVDPAFQFNFSLPILTNPAQGVFDLLLGHDTPLVSLTAEMHVDADSGNADGLSFSGVGLTFHGFVKADAKLTFNYDTFGLREVIRDLGPGGNAGSIPGDIADGFYVDTANTSLSVSGGIYAQLGASYGIVSIGVNGGINTGNLGNEPITVNVIDPGNGKLRFQKIAAAVDAGGLLSLFHLAW